jgi:flagellar hook-basal body complex protein FliE
MAKMPKGYAEQFKALNHLTRSYKQERKAQNFQHRQSAINLLGELIQNCELSQNVLRSQGEESTMGYRQLTDVIAACQEALVLFKSRGGS